jgi:hypothetical protein
LSIDGIDPTRSDRFNRTAAEVPFDVWRSMGVEVTDILTPHCHPGLFREPYDPQDNVVPFAR